MAPKITSSSNRSKRKPSSPKPITTSKGRGNRASVSKATVTDSDSRPRNTGAKVTNSSQRTNTGSAPVTGSGRPALPPGQKGGALAKPNPAAKPQLTGTRPAGLLPGGTGGADTVRGSGVRTGRPGAPRPSLPSAVSGSAVKSAVKSAGGLRAGLIGMVAAPVVDEVGRRAGTALGNSIRQAATPQRTGTSSGRTGRGGTTADVKPNTASKPRIGNIPPAEGTGRGGPSDIRKSKPTATTPTRSQSTQQRATQAPRSSNSGGTTSTPRRNTPMPSVVKERRVSASTANRESGNYGTSRTNNPLMRDLKAGMERREQGRADKAISDGKATRAEYNRTSPPEVAAKAKENFDKLSDKEKKRVKDRYS